MYKYVFLDFNGTVLDDVDLCYSLLNELLKKQNKKEITLARYKEVFGFPIKSYYEKAGIDFNLNSFDELAVEFIAKYQPASLKCSIYDGVIEVINYLKTKSIKVILFSASETNNLIAQLKHFGIYELLDDVIGNDNIYAYSKEKRGINYMKDNNINPSEAIYLGDTDHDYLCARSMNITPVLISKGHQSKSKLLETGARVIDDIRDVKELL